MPRNDWRIFLFHLLILRYFETCILTSGMQESQAQGDRFQPLENGIGVNPPPAGRGTWRGNVPLLGTINIRWLGVIPVVERWSTQVAQVLYARSFSYSVNPSSTNISNSCKSGSIRIPFFKTKDTHLMTASAPCEIPVVPNLPVHFSSLLKLNGLLSSFHAVTWDLIHTCVV